MVWARCTLSSTMSQTARISAPSMRTRLLTCTVPMPPTHTNPIRTRSIGAANQRPDAAAEAGAKRGAGDGAQLSRRPRERRRLRNLVAEKPLGKLLRAIDQRTDAPQIAAGGEPQCHGGNDAF